MATVLSAANWPIVGQLCTLLGIVMNKIYMILTTNLNVQSGAVGLSIIIYTILVYTLMLPFTIKQQKTSKLTAIINPEVQAIQKKYKNKKDQVSVMKQQEEIQAVYDKYGTSMMGGCLPLLIQMPFLFALYPVIYKITDYVPALKDAPASVQSFLSFPNLTEAPLQMIKSAGSYDISKGAVIFACIALPLLSGASQWFNIKLGQAVNGQSMDKDNPMASTMNTMNITMPLFSVFMVFTLPAGIGLYWFFSAVVRSVQMVVINRSLSNISPEELVEKNKEKAAAKAKKRGEKNERILSNIAKENTKSNSSRNSSTKMTAAEREAKVEAAKKNAGNAKAGSLAAKANMVNNYNKKNSK